MEYNDRIAQKKYIEQSGIENLEQITILDKINIEQNTEQNRKKKTNGLYLACQLIEENKPNSFDD